MILNYVGYNNHMRDKAIEIKQKLNHEGVTTEEKIDFIFQDLFAEYEQSEFFIQQRIAIEEKIEKEKAERASKSFFSCWFGGSK